MADSIPAPFLIIIGAAMAIVSLGLTFTGSNLTLFIIAGGVILIYGVFKMFATKKEPKTHKTHHLAHCPNCKVPIHPKQNFCAHCGARLK